MLAHRKATNYLIKPSVTWRKSTPLMNFASFKPLFFHWKSSCHLLNPLISLVALFEGLQRQELTTFRLAN